MALTFPPQPQEVGTSYLAPNGTTYIWDGTKWAGVVTQGSGGTGGVANIEIRDHGNTATTSTTVINFTGTSVITTATGTIVTVTISGATELTTATTSTLGGVKIGQGIAITGDGTISTLLGLQYWTETQSVIDGQTAITSFVVSGTQTNIDAVIKSKGLGATANDDEGGKRGEYAVDWQSVRGVDAEVASGNFAVIDGGSFNKATGLHSIVIGGNNNTSDAEYAVVLGGNNGNTRGIKGSVIMPGFATGGASASSGLIQAGYYVMSAETNNSSPVSLSTDGNPTVSTSNQITLVDKEAVYFKGTILGKEINVLVPEINVWNVEGVVKRDVGNTTTNYSYQQISPIAALITSINTTSNWNVIMDIDDSTGCMLINVQGQMGHTVRWAAKFETIEITDTGM
jgi:hypothetical protein